MMDPFLFLNHHGPQVYPPNNRGLPFGPHPHRGFETVTFILDGDIAHRDSAGHESVIGRHGIQWMTAGRGLVHSEHSSAEFKAQGGPLEILQLWVNLPARLKMTTPRYTGLQGNEIPIVESDAGKVRARLVAGQWQGKTGPVKPLTEITVMTVEIDAQGAMTIQVPAEHVIFFYVIRGAAEVNGQHAEARHLVQFGEEGEALHISGLMDATVLLCHGLPTREPIVAHGPFVMNTREEIQQAILDYQQGRLA